MKAADVRADEWGGVFACVRRPEPYINPYLAGVGVGVVLLAAFVIMGRGLGASGAFSTVVSVAASGVAPAAAESNEAFARYLTRRVCSATARASSSRC